MTEPEVTLPIEFVDDAAWLLLSSLPLIIAIINHRQRKRVGMSSPE